MKKTKGRNCGQRVTHVEPKERVTAVDEQKVLSQQLKKLGKETDLGLKKIQQNHVDDILDAAEHVPPLFGPDQPEDTSSLTCFWASGQWSEFIDSGTE